MLKNYQRLFHTLFILFLSLTAQAADKANKTDKQAQTENSSPQIKVNVEITGIRDDELLKNIKNYLQIEQQKEHKRLSVRRIRRLHKQSTEDIIKALQPFGYYRPKIITSLKPPESEDNKTWQAQYQITPGESLKVHQVEVKILGMGQTDSAFEQLVANFPIAKGDVLYHPDYDKGKMLLRGLAEERGYFHAHLTEHRIEYNETDYQASIFLTFDTGPRYRFGELVFEQDILEEDIIGRYQPFAAGDPYNAEKLIIFERDLENSGYFTEVEIEVKRPTTPQAEGELVVPVNVQFTERKRTAYSASIGYGTDTGIRGTVRFERRYINKYGHKFSIEAKLSEIRQSVTAQYFIPYSDNQEEFLSLKAGYIDESTDIIDSETLVIGLAKHHPRLFFNRYKVNEVLGLEYRDEKYTVGEDSGHASLLMPNASWSYVKADNRMYTLKGFKLQLDIRGALNQLGSDNSFLQTHLSSTFIRKLHEKGRLIARGELGYSFISLLDGEFRDLPPSIRYFAGGDRSVRGYDYNELGPTDSQGQVIGGENLMVGSLEYEHIVIDKWSVAAFYDVGNAFDNFSDPLKQGAGLGVRWQSPVGLVRVDVATALSEDNYPIRLHVTVGPDL